MSPGAETEPARIERERAAAPNAWWGVAMLIATEATLFAALIATYFYLRFNADQWPPAGTPEPPVALPVGLTAMLVASSVPLLAGVRAAVSGRRRAAWWLLLTTAVVQGAYLGLQIQAMVGDLSEFEPDESAYGSIYYTLLGVHHAHVAVGLALDAWLLGSLLAGLTAYRVAAVRVIAAYWYFVAAAGILVTLTVLYPSL